MVEPTGRELFDEVLKVRNDLAGWTLVMVAVTVPADVVTSMPDCVDWTWPAETTAWRRCCPRGVDEGEESHDAQR